MKNKNNMTNLHKILKNQHKERRKEGKNLFVMPRIVAHQT